MKPTLQKSTAGLAALLAGLMLAGPLSAKDSLPDVTSDGLKRVKSKNVDALYVQDGATLDAYTEVMILEAPVAFRKDWMRDHNRDEIDLSQRVDQDDMDRMKSELSAEFKEEFTKTLEKGGYKVVDQTGENVLLLRPAIINLDVSAPDTRRSTGMSRTYTASAGSMTLYMELYDSATSAKIAEIVDARATSSTMTFQMTNSVTNKADADRMLRNWANLLVKALDEAHGK